jgi:hypothetical protein
VKTSPWRIAAALSLVAVGVAIFIFIVHNNNAGQRDFISYWAAGQQLVHGRNPYDRAAITELERLLAAMRKRIFPAICRRCLSGLA